MDDKLRHMQAGSDRIALPFRAVLTPHRSLTSRGFLMFMLVISAVSFAAGIAFVMMGAWPVMGFFGLDVALVYLAFRLNYRAARATETIDVTRDELTVTRLSAAGQVRSVAKMSSTWVRLDEVEAPDGSVSLALASRGRRVVVARDLGSDARRNFAVTLRAVLRLVREPVWPT